jgi:hypothetical protein
MNNVDALRISQQRDDIYDWACTRFKDLIAEDRTEDALAFADEYFEWLDPEQLDNEVTLFFDERELAEYFQSFRS